MNGNDLSHKKRRRTMSRPMFSFREIRNACPSWPNSGMNHDSSPTTASMSPTPAFTKACRLPVRVPEWGVRRQRSPLKNWRAAAGRPFCGMGTCAAIQDYVKPGDIAIFDSACRFEGTSGRYVPPEYPAVAHHENYRRGD